MKQKLTLKQATTQEDIQKCYAVRAIVFVEEQQVPYTLELDEHDPTATHILGEINDEPVAAARYRFIDDHTVKLERIAIRKQWRGLGLGHP